MGLNRLLKKLLSGKTLEEALYKKLTENTLNEDLYKTDELGEGMEVVYQVINGWWKPRYILNHNTRTAFEFMSHSQYLLTVETEDIEWSSLKKLPESVINNAKTQFAMFPTFVESFLNGVIPNNFTQFMIRNFGIHKDEVRSPFMILSDEMVYEERFAIFHTEPVIFRFCFNESANWQFITYLVHW